MWKERFNPFRDLEDIFEDFWGGPRRLRWGIVPYERCREPFTDLQETEKEVIITMEVPGVEKQDIKIDITEDRIEISAERKDESKEEGEGYLRRERRYGRFYKALTLPAAVDHSKVKATYKNGVLEILLPKIEKKTKVRVE
jgi:HSP20 family protein